MKLAPVGVGNVGTAPAVIPFGISNVGSGLLDGVTGESTDRLGAGTDTFLVLNAFEPESCLPKLSGAEGTLPIARAGDGMAESPALVP